MWLWSARPKTWGLQNGRFAVSNKIRENHQNQEESFSYTLLIFWGLFEFVLLISDIIRILCFHNFIKSALICCYFVCMEAREWPKVKGLKVFVAVTQKRSLAAIDKEKVHLFFSWQPVSLYGMYDYVWQRHVTGGIFLH